MAKLKEKVIGKVSGTLGDFVGRIRNGSNYLSMKPSSFKVNNNPAAKERRGKFRMACKLSKAVTSPDDIKVLWKKYNAQISPYNNALKINYPFVSSAETTDFVTLAPDMGFPISVSDMNISSTQITISLEALNNADAFDLNVETKIKLFGVIFLKEPTNAFADDYQFLSFTSTEQALVTDTGLSFTINLTGSQTNYFNLYSTNKLHFMICTLNDLNEIIHFSNTLAGS